MDANEFRAEIAGIFREQDRRMEKLDKKMEVNAAAIEKNIKSIDESARTVTKLTELLG